MKKFLLGSAAALALWLGLGASDASAAWQYRTVSRYDPACGRHVVVTERYWVPDYGLTIQPALRYNSGYYNPYYSSYRYNPRYDHYGHGQHGHNHHNHSHYGQPRHR